MSLIQIDYQPEINLYLLVLSGLSLMVLLWWRPTRLSWRLSFGLVVLLALSPPIIKVEQHRQLEPIAAIIIDNSPSQQLGNRPDVTAKTRNILVDDLRSKGIQAKIMGLPSQDRAGHTYLGSTLAQTLRLIPAQRRAGIIVLTDGQIHDADTIEAILDSYDQPPFYVLLTDDPDVHDRFIAWEKPPSFGIVGNDVTIKVKAVDPAQPPGTPIPVIIGLGPTGEEQRLLSNGTLETIKVPITRRGPNPVYMRLLGSGLDITTRNNSVAFTIRGIRDRLRVLLISGQPSISARVWRDFLKSDPNVDLIHLTVLGSAYTQDPPEALSLIPFPVEEVFDKKIDQFDLIVFNHFQRRSIITPAHAQRIIRFVEDGGALLVEDARWYHTILSLTQTALGSILPAKSSLTLNGEAMIETPFIPQPSDKGQRHPITKNLSQEVTPGPWFRQAITVVEDQGHTLMVGHDNSPLLVIGRAGKGRVAQLLSDQIWLWRKNADGPYDPLMRRLIHWLMQEPELEEYRLEANVVDNTLIVKRQSWPDTDNDYTLTVTSPSGIDHHLTLTPSEQSDVLTGSVNIDEEGLYTVQDEDRISFATTGDQREWQDVRATPDILAQAATSSNSAVLTLDDLLPIRVVRPGAKRSDNAITLIDQEANHLSQSLAFPTKNLLVGVLLLLLIGLWRRSHTLT